MIDSWWAPRTATPGKNVRFTIGEVILMRFYISDLHFGHARLNTEMDKRGFESGEEMNRYMIHQWNSRVRHGDEVIILGDLCMYKGAEDAEAIIRQLKGKKYLVVGNHDYYLDSKSFDRSLFKWIGPYLELNDDRRKVVLSHYPVFCYDGQYRRNGDGVPKTYMLYGHVHNTFDEVLVNDFIMRTRECRRETRENGELQNIPCQMINCFCMFSDYVPLTLDEWIWLDANRRKRMERL